MSDEVVEVCDLTRRFGQQIALDQITLSVQPGCVVGLVGANGAGKTTLIKHLLGLLRARQGCVRVFGLDPVKHPVEVLRRIGYLSEERELPEWMRIDELLRYTAAFHPNWDHAFAAELLGTFRLNGKKKIKELSKGMRAQAGLVAAVAHRPDLLLLDEPSTGLDAIVRKDILNAIIRTVADDGRTAIFSSHLLDEVELMSDVVYIIHQGKIVVRGLLDDIQEQHHALSVRFVSPTSVPDVDGLLAAERLGGHWNIVCRGAREAIVAALRREGGEVMQARSASLQEIFVAAAAGQSMSLASRGSDA